MKQKRLTRTYDWEAELRRRDRPREDMAQWLQQRAEAEARELGMLDLDSRVEAEHLEGRLRFVKVYVRGY